MWTGHFQVIGFFHIWKNLYKWDLYNQNLKKNFVRVRKTSDFWGKYWLPEPQLEKSLLFLKNIRCQKQNSKLFRGLVKNSGFTLTNVEMLFQTLAAASPSTSRLESRVTMLQSERDIAHFVEMSAW